MYIVQTQCDGVLYNGFVAGKDARSMGEVGPKSGQITGVSRRCLPVVSVQDGSKTMAKL